MRKCSKCSNCADLWRDAKVNAIRPYQRLGEAHEAIQQWCKTHGREFAWPCWETYGHWIDEWNKDPSKIRTDVSSDN